MNELFHTIAEQNDMKLIAANFLFGGDINDVFHLKMDQGDFVVKFNDEKKFPRMFEVEQKGLELLRSTHSFFVPKTYTHDLADNKAYLLMEFIPDNTPKKDFWEDFGVKLAKLHRTTQAEFGLDHDNYIGSLVQYNKKSNTAQEFYISQRLKPQFKLAKENGFSFSNLDAFYENVSNEIPNEASAFVHGDLWSGNYMVCDGGNPALIDPAVAYASREMDLAMMQLFGGFPDEVFQVYNENFPLEKNWEKRISIWQLYYLLVHLNLFGVGYLAQVKSIIKKYS